GYLDTVMAMFLKTLSKAYSPCDFTDADKTKLRGYLERIFEAKQAVAESGKPSNGCVMPE
ncbi:MAG TPA: hypothetical protein VFT82_00645, partial [Candidatus Paceibacterota bacterium]|nr:hypothetical protein [Candidatus Paceibacterota bacterium]